LWKQSATGVLLAFGQEIVSGAEHRSEQQVEVGEHLGPPWVGVRLTPPTSTALLPNPAEVAANAEVAIGAARLPLPINLPRPGRDCGDRHRYLLDVGEVAAAYMEIPVVCEPARH
jgi:hypothetical protein